MASHIYMTDFSAYGYAGTSIEKLEVETLEEHLAGDVASLNSVVRGKSLLDLALDNIDYMSEDEEKAADVFAVLNTLIKSKAIEKDKVFEDGSSFLSKLVDKLEKYKDHPEIKKSLGKAIVSLAAEYPDPASFLKPLQSTSKVSRDMKIVKALGIDGDAVDVAMLNGLIEKDELPVVRGFIKSNHYSTDVWKQVNPFSAMKMMDYISDNKKWSNPETKLEEGEVNLLQAMPERLKGRYVEAMAAKLRESGREDQLKVLKESGLISEEKIAEKAQEVIRYNKYSELNDLLSGWGSEEHATEKEIELVRAAADEKLTEQYIAKIIEGNKLHEIKTLFDQGFVAEEDKAKILERHSVASIYNLKDDKLLSIRIEHATMADLSSSVKDDYSILHIACLNGQVELAKKLIDKGADINLAADKGLTPVHMLALSKHKDGAMEVFQAMKSAPGFKDIKFDQTIYSVMALKGGNVSLANELIRSAPDRKILQTEVLYRAVKSDDSELVKNLLASEGAADLSLTNVNVAGEDVDLLNLSMRGDGATFKAIMDSGNSNIKVTHTLLATAVEGGMSNAVQAILERPGVEVNLNQITISKIKVGGLFNSTEEEQNANILNDGYRRRTDLEGEVSDLLKEESGAATDAKEAIQRRIVAKKEEIGGVYAAMNKLLVHNVDEYNKGEKAVELLDVNTALRINLAANEGIGKKSNPLTNVYTELALLRCQGASKDDEKIKQREELLYNILNHPSADLNIPDEYGQNLLMLAAQYGDRSVVGLAILRGAENAEKDRDGWNKILNAVDNNGNTALFYASQFGEVDTFELLIMEGAELRRDGKLITNKNGVNPLMAACASGYIKMVEAIEYSKSDVAVVDNKGNNPMHYLAMGFAQAEAADILQNLLDADAEINAQNYEGETPLIKAVINKDANLVAELLKKGADVNLADGKGNTPLIYACLLNNKDVIKAVLDAGNLNINHQNNAGISAYLVVAQRDGLERLSPAAVEKMLETLDKEKKEEKRVGVEAARSAMRGIDDKTLEIVDVNESNSYPDLAKVMISRGADPYISDPVNLLNSMANVTAAIAGAKIASASSGVIANSLPIYGGAAAELLKLGSSVAAVAVVRSNVGQVVKESFISYMINETDLDKRVDLKGSVMIGAVHDKGFGFIRRGLALEKDIKGHSNFSNADAIYTIDALKEAVIGKNKDGASNAGGVKSVEWCLKAHDDLTSQYIAVQKRIESQPWYYTFPLVWKGRGLKNAAKDILEADEVLHAGHGREFSVVSVVSPSRAAEDKTFEGIYGGGKGSLIEILKSPSRSKQLLSAAASGNNEAKKLEEVIDKVVKKEVSVAPDTYYNCIKFTEARSALNNQSRINAFIANNKPLQEFAPVGDGLNELVVAKSKAMVRNPKIGEVSHPIKPPSMFAKGLKWLTGSKTEYAAVNRAGEALSQVVGTAAGTYVVAEFNPDVKRSVNQAVSTAAMGAGATAMVASAAINIAANNPMMIMAAAVVAYNKDAIMSGVSNVYNWLTSPAAPKKEVKASVKDVVAASKLDADTKEAFAVLNDAAKFVEVVDILKEKKEQEREVIEAVVEEFQRVEAKAAPEVSSQAVPVPQQVVDSANGAGVDGSVGASKDIKAGEGVEVDAVKEVSPQGAPPQEAVAAPEVMPAPNKLESVLKPEDHHKESTPLSENGLINRGDMHTAAEALTTDDVEHHEVDANISGVSAIAEKRMGVGIAEEVEDKGVNSIEKGAGG